MVVKVVMMTALQGFGKLLAGSQADAQMSIYTTALLLRSPQSACRDVTAQHIRQHGLMAEPALES